MEAVNSPPIARVVAMRKKTNRMPHDSPRVSPKTSRGMAAVLVDGLWHTFHDPLQSAPARHQWSVRSAQRLSVVPCIPNVACSCIQILRRYRNGRVAAIRVAGSLPGTSASSSPLSTTSRGTVFLAYLYRVARVPRAISETVLYHEVLLNEGFIRIAPAG